MLQLAEFRHVLSSSPASGGACTPCRSAPQPARPRSMHSWAAARSHCRRPASPTMPERRPRRRPPRRACARARARETCAAARRGGAVAVAAAAAAAPVPAALDAPAAGRPHHCRRLPPPPAPGSQPLLLRLPRHPLRPRLAPALRSGTAHIVRRAAGTARGGVGRKRIAKARGSPLQFRAPAGSLIGSERGHRKPPRTRGAYSCVLPRLFGRAEARCELRMVRICILEVIGRGKATAAATGAAAAPVHSSGERRGSGRGCGGRTHNAAAAAAPRPKQPRIDIPGRASDRSAHRMPPAPPSGAAAAQQAAAWQP
eukprot:357798-Chlamydomonas_euryale.AAC.15